MYAERLRVTVVEDCEVMRSLLVDELVAHGFDTDGCADAASLWQRLSRSPCDLVVLDIGLPDEDGFSVSRRLREHDGLSVVILTGYAGGAQQLFGTDQGVDAYLIKPVESPVLIDAIRRIRRRLVDREPIGAAGGDGWCLAEQGWSLHTPDRREIPLNAYERDLLHHLLGARGDGVTRARLQVALSRESHPLDAQRLDRVVRHLHHKVSLLSRCALPLKDDPVTGSLCLAGPGAPSFSLPSL